MPPEPGRVLVADDNEDNRQAIARLLLREGYDAIGASSGRAALELAHEQRPSVLVLEVELPDLPGFEVTEQLRADPATQAIAILEVSVRFADAKAQAAGLRRGADACLARPVDDEVLLATIAALLRIRSAEQRAEAQRERAECSERRYHFIADMVPQIIWSCDSDRRPDYFNRRWYELTGQEEEASHATNLTDSMYPDDRTKFCAAWEHAHATGQPLEIECRRWG
jgi:CheY-like chemotaxis protein